MNSPERALLVLKGKTSPDTLAGSFYQRAACPPQPESERFVKVPLKRRLFQG